MSDLPSSPFMTPQDQALNERTQRSRASWRRLGQQIQAITPVTLARILLVTGGLLVLGWLLILAWPALIPFIVGGILAYAVLPLVNWLDRLMPRRLAALLVMVTVLGVLILFVARFIPAMGLQFSRLMAILPVADELGDSIREFLNSSFSSLPPSMRDAITSILERTVMSLRSNVDNLFSSLPGMAVGLLLSLIRAIGAVLGLLVLPTWLLIVLSDYQKGVQSVNQVLPRPIRRDFWAVARIIDRSFRTFFERQVTQGVLVSLLFYVALRVLMAQGLVQLQYPLVAAMIAGFMELIPEIGPLVGLIILGLFGLLISPQTALFGLIAYGLIHLLVGRYVDSRAKRKVREVHPAVLIVVVVLFSQLGLIWVLLSVPFSTAIRDLFRYAYGRLSDPPRPAGLVPDEVAAAGSASTNRPQRIPLVYRRMPATSQTRPANIPNRSDL